MTFISWELAKALEEQYRKEHPNEKPLNWTKEQYIEYMKKKGFHFTGD